jgi:hypothetical protein
MGRFECFVGVDRGVRMAALGAQEKWRDPPAGSAQNGIVLNA